MATGSEYVDGAEAARDRDRAVTTLAADPYRLRAELAGLVEAYEEVAGGPSPPGPPRGGRATMGRRR